MLCGDIRKHVDLQCSDIKKDDDLSAVIMTWAIAKRIEKETRNGDLGAVDTSDVTDQTPFGLDDNQDWSWVNSIRWQQPNMGEIYFGAKWNYQGKGPQGPGKGQYPPHQQWPNKGSVKRNLMMQMMMTMMKAMGKRYHRKQPWAKDRAKARDTMSATTVANRATLRGNAPTPDRATTAGSKGTWPRTAANLGEGKEGR